VDSEPAFTAYCHCTACRRATAAPCYWGAAYRKADVRILSTKGGPVNTIQHVALTNARHSCAKCGTLIFEDSVNDDMYILPAAIMRHPPPAQFHIFTKFSVMRMADDGLPRYEEFPVC